MAPSPWQFVANLLLEAGFVDFATDNPERLEAQGQEVQGTDGSVSPSEGLCDRSDYSSNIIRQTQALCASCKASANQVPADWQGHLP